MENIEVTRVADRDYPFPRAVEIMVNNVSTWYVRMSPGEVDICAECAEPVQMSHGKWCHIVDKPYNHEAVINE